MRSLWSRIEQLCLWIDGKPYVLALLGMALVAPSLTAGMVSDDYYIGTLGRHMDTPSGSIRDAWDLFHFADGIPEHNLALIDKGWVPWWTDLALRWRFMRPLSALTHLIDFTLWPDSPVWMHVQSILWFGLLIWVVARFYRRAFGPSLTVASGLAALMFAVDDAHGVPVGWLCNRNIVLAALLGVLALDCHWRWRSERWRPGAALAPLLLALALACCEAAVSIAGYVLAHALLIERGSWRSRLGSFVPCAMVCAAWYGCYRSFDFGVAASGIYVNPGYDLRQYAARFVEAAPLLLLAQFALPNSIFGAFASAAVFPLYWLGITAGVLAVAWLLWPLLVHERLARFFFAGMLASVPPAAAGIISDRLLMFIGIGAMGVLASWLHGLARQAAWVPAQTSWTRAATGARVSFLAIHLAFAPLGLLPSSLFMSLASRDLLALQNTLPRDAGLARQRLVLVNSLQSLGDVGWLHSRRYRGAIAPRSLLVLGPAESDAALTRLDARTLLVRPHGGYLDDPGHGDSDRREPPFSARYFMRSFDHVFRSDTRSLPVGTELDLTDLQISVREVTEDGRPAAVAFQFATPLENDALRFMVLAERGYEPFTPPAIGETVRVARPAL
jgi:hypothetical protein